MGICLKGGEIVMKKSYETPDVEVIKFRYSDQVVADSGCIVQVTHAGPNSCVYGEHTYIYHK